MYFIVSDEDDISVSSLSLSDEKTVIENGKHVNGVKNEKNHQIK